ncbi:uncharacterized protein LOC130591336 [Beta vulgaris subsp. vulgaris]|uniref:uncharacterized protein LOC130591336 n=1 Tax=Beta vulgaris subsp. vulgaris TaxID=3555 RepID=UPI002548C583|nr:uncharacterized protein LOC130591336 [Beta vulgaris subsp. vulgaris]
MSLLSWNCRGLKNLSSQNLGFISSIASTNSIDCIFLSETKCQVSCLEPFFSKLGFQGCKGFDADGTKGGLFLCWSRSIVVSMISTSKNHVCCSIKDVTGFIYYVAFVYGSPVFADRSEIWDNLTIIMDNNKGKWLLMGDFNQVENNNQKLGGSLVLKGATQFLDWKLTNHLLDIPYHGVNYTWTNNRSNSAAIYERLDKAFCNSDWKDNYPDADVWNLPIQLSDHSPLVLHLHKQSEGKRKRPYRLDAWSLHHPEVCEIIKREWEESPEGSPALSKEKFRIRLETFEVGASGLSRITK